MLEEIIASQLPNLEILARGWLAGGATSFSIIDNSRVLACWPENSRSPNGALKANIEVDQMNGIKLAVEGINITQAEKHLEADAKLVSKLLQQEMELNSLTSELIYTRDQMLALYNLTRATRNKLSIEQSLIQLAYESTWLLKSEAAFLYFESRNQKSYSAQHPSQFFDQRTLKELLEIYQSLQGSVLQFRRGDIRLRHNIHNMLLVPIRSRELPVALLGVVNKKSGDFMSQDIKLIRAIAEFTGAHLENMVLFQNRIEQADLNAEMRLASQIQSRLSPSLPSRVNGIDLWAGSRPASHVGGDFYDFVQRSDESISMVVGDVSGKGMPAALLVAMTKAVVRSEILSQSVPSSDVIISTSNEKLYKDFTDVSMFATMFVGRYDPVLRSLKYVNAGHSPVVFSPAGGSPSLLRADVTPIGISPSIFPQESLLEIHEGDVVVIATDGFSSATNTENQELGYENLLEIIDSLSGESAKEIAEGMFENIDAFSKGASQTDDQTIVVIKGVSG